MNLVLASPSDISPVLEMIRATAKWLKTKGIVQWGDAFPRESLEKEVENDELFVLFEDGKVIGSVALSENPGEMWDGLRKPALYLSRVVIPRDQAGKQLGKSLMEFAEGEAIRREFKLIRLVCDSKNPFLPGFYKSLGYRSAGTKFHAPWKITFETFEKELCL